VWRICLSRTRVHPVTAYARKVTAGKIVAGRLVKLACERHLSDLAKYRAGRGKLYFDNEAASRAIKFFTVLHHSKGEWAGQRFILRPWQEFIIGSIFGWKRQDGTRRFRTAYQEVSRKNGKTCLAAGVSLLLAFFDNEPGAEAYIAATKRDQAKIAWSEAKRMVEATPELKKRIQIWRGVSNLSIESRAQKLEPLGADSDTLDGLNIHGAVIDELHAHKNRNMVDVIDTATGARRQPLLFEITTAGYDRQSVCWEHHDYSIKVLEGIIQDDTWFGYIACADEGDDWTNQKTWKKANPNLGVSVHLDDLKRKCEKAKEMPAAQNAFRQKHLDEWTEQSERWISIDKWDACAEPRAERDLLGELCFGGLDLASTRDITAFVLAFPDDGAFDLLCRFWVPDEQMRERVKTDRVPYDVWLKQGFLKTTPGNVTDYDFIREEIRELAAKYDIREIAYDRWGATQLATQLQEDGAEMVEFGQGFGSMAAPTKELERLMLDKKIRHGGHPIMRWMASNVAVKRDPADNMKIDKSKSTEKVDGMVALAMAIGRASVFLNEPPERSVYEDRDLLVL
jgi:phage terminase large subunit-like protein